MTQAPHVEAKIMKWSHAQLRRSAQRLAELLKDLPGFISVGFTDNPSLEVLLRELTAEAAARVPSKFDGLVVDRVVTGEIEAF